MDIRLNVSHIDFISIRVAALHKKASITASAAINANCENLLMPRLKRIRFVASTDFLKILSILAKALFFSTLPLKSRFIICLNLLTLRLFLFGRHGVSSTLRGEPLFLAYLILIQ